MTTATRDSSCSEHDEAAEPFSEKRRATFTSGTLAPVNGATLTWSRSKRAEHTGVLEAMPEVPAGVSSRRSQAISELAAAAWRRAALTASRGLR